jgi:hypothetical protein
MLDVYTNALTVTPYGFVIWYEVRVKLNAPETLKKELELSALAA